MGRPLEGNRRVNHVIRRAHTHKTPTHASWLHAAEIEIGVLARTALRRRVASFQEWQRQVAACTRRRNEKRATIDRRFTREKARETFRLPSMKTTRTKH